jgi:hypothetical protein
VNRAGAFTLAGLIAILAAGASSLSPQTSSAVASSDPVRVLFIGNSLTAYNDVPAIVEALAKAGGQPALDWKSVLLPGTSLEDQWRDGQARKAIGQGPWDYVVLQQGPSALDESRRSLLDYVGRFAKEIRAVGARPAIYMVWPSSSRTSDFDEVSQSYRMAARQVDGLLFPVGEAWRAAWKRDSKLALYSKDGLHPTPAGSYLAALVMYGQLYGKSPVGLPGTLALSGGDSVEVPEAKLLQESAEEANRKFSKP